MADPRQKNAGDPPREEGKTFIAPNPGVHASIRRPYVRTRIIDRRVKRDA